jgi:hypothetical protein
MLRALLTASLFFAPAVIAEPVTIADVLDAIAIVESNNNPNAVGDNGKAVGAFQIHKIYVDDVNRILGEDKYSYDDRWDAEKSRKMTLIYTLHYTKKYNHTAESMAAVHNGGVDGYEQFLIGHKRIKNYVQKVINVLEKGE